MKIYRVIDQARDTMYVRAETPTEAQTKYEAWRDTPGNIEHPEVRHVVSVQLVATNGMTDVTLDSPVEHSQRWPNYID